MSPEYSPSKLTLAQSYADLDPYFDEVSLLVNGEGGDGSVFADSSNNNLAITRNGSPTQSSFSPYSRTTPYSANVRSGSGYFGGSADYLTLPGGLATNFGTGDFTVEAWIFFSNVSNTTFYIFDNRNASQTATWAFFRNGFNQLEWYTGSASLTGSPGPSSDQWSHIAYCRSGTTGRLFINGAQVGSGTDSTNYSVSSTISYVGSRFSLAEYINGYISDFRITKGAALYTSSFTSPVAPLTAGGNTSLLLSFTNGGVVDATGSASLRPIGNTRIETAQRKNGAGALYFDGTGDYALVSENSVINLTGDFTIEAWLYPAANGQNTIVSLRNGGAGTTMLRIRLQSGGVQIFANASGVSLDSGVVSSVPVNTWTHFACVRRGGIFELFLNGSSVYTSTAIPASASLTAGGSFNVIGGFSDFSVIHLFNGYMDDLRITKNIARYTSKFTPPVRSLPDRRYSVSEPDQGVVKQGLILSLDAGQRESYRGSGATWADLSGGARSATLISSPTYQSSPRKYLTFSDVGGQYATAPLSGTLGQWSMEALVRFTAEYASSGKIAAVITREGSGAGEVNFTMGQLKAPGSRNICIGFVDSWGTGGWKGTNGVQYALNQWVYITGTYDGTTIKQYTNGRFTEAFAFTAVFNNFGNLPIRINRRWDSSVGAGQLFGCDLALARVYNRALTEGEVRQNFNLVRQQYEL